MANQMNWEEAVFFAEVVRDVENMVGAFADWFGPGNAIVGNHMAESFSEEDDRVGAVAMTYNFFVDYDAEPLSAYTEQKKQFIKRVIRFIKDRNEMQSRGRLALRMKVHGEGQASSKDSEYKTFFDTDYYFSITILCGIFKGEGE